jgi:carboxyl-terminal processing protease
MRLFATLLLALTFCCLRGEAFAPQLAYGENPKNARTFAPLLNCQEAKSRIDSMLDLHFYFSEFNEELSKRTSKKIFETLDPGKIYFIKPDIISFENTEKNVGKKLKQNNCTFLFDINKLFLKRVHERSEKAKSILTKQIDFSKYDFISTSKLDWSINTEEANDRIRKKIKLQFLTTKENNETELKVRERLLRNYIRIEKKYEEVNNDKLYSILLNSFALSMDPHSAHMLPSDHDSFVIHISNKLEGIGAQLQEKDGYIIVRSLVQGGVAQKDGRLKPKDKIIAVDAGNGEGLQDLINTDVDQAVNLIRGKKESNLKLVVLRKTNFGNEKININLVRDEVDLKEDEVKTETFQSNNGKIGIIKIPTFYTDLKCKTKIFAQCKGVSFDVEKGLRKLSQEGINGLLIDLRNNGGGDFPESIKLTGLFIPNGTAVQTLDKTHSIRRQAIDESSWIYKGPLVVLINKYSASASEIFSGAIQDYERGIIVGDRSTYGKASVQIVQEIPGTQGRKTDGALKVTQSKFYRPGGTSNQKLGVQSNIVIPSILEAYDIGEEQLDYALPTDSIPQAKGFKPLQDLSLLVNRLKLLSKERILKNLNYQELLEKIEKIKKDKNKNLPITMEFAKIIEEQEAPHDLNDDENENETSLINQNDLQLVEAINITSDSIKLSGNQNFWVGMSGSH